MSNLKRIPPKLTIDFPKLLRNFLKNIFSKNFFSSVDNLRSKQIKNNKKNEYPKRNVPICRFTFLYIYLFKKKTKDRLIQDYKFISIPYFQFLV